MQIKDICYKIEINELRPITAKYPQAGGFRFVDRKVINFKRSNYTDYIALGKIRYSTRKGALVDGTFVCTASITMSIISANQKSIAKSFSLSENGNGVTESQAKEAATEKLVNKYYNEYSSL